MSRAGVCSEGPEAINYRDESRKNSLEIIIGNFCRIESEVILHDLPERLDRLVIRKSEVFILNIDLAE
jgi:hypothetical protein